MRQIKPNSLSSASTTTLTAKQQLIDKETTYQLQCEKATEMWENKTNNAAFEEVKRLLKAVDSPMNSCHYCEKNTATDIEHIFPKSLFPEKAFVWENYVYACNVCNQQYKQSHFAIWDNHKLLDITPKSIYEKTTKKNQRIYQKPQNQDNMFIDSRNENPMDFVEIDLENECLYRPKRELAKGSKEYEKAIYTLNLLGFILDKEDPDKYREDMRVSRENAYDNYVTILERYDKVNNAATEEELVNSLPQHLISTAKSNMLSLEASKAEMMENLKKSIKKQLHQSIWEEMKRQHQHIPELKTLFDKIPAALTW